MALNGVLLIFEVGKLAQSVYNLLIMGFDGPVSEYLRGIFAKKQSTPKPFPVKLSGF